MPNTSVPANADGLPNSDSYMALIDERWLHYRLSYSAEAEVDAQAAFARMVDADSMIIKAKATTPEHGLAALNPLRHELETFWIDGGDRGARLIYALLSQVAGVLRRET